MHTYNRLGFVSLLGLSLIALAGCGANSTDTSSSDTSLSSGSGSMNSIADAKTCTDAVQAYLTQMKENTIDTSTSITKDNHITVDYVGRLADGSVFDTSVESVARACGMYTSQRNYTEGLSFNVGAGQMIAGFDKAVVGMKKGETKTISIDANDAYGPAMIELPLDQLPSQPDGSQYKVGDTLMSSSGPVKIAAMTDKTFSIANSHPLAGKDLIFDITIKSIN